MKKLIYTFLIAAIAVVFLGANSFAQRILINEGFENSGFNSDSLPTGWFKLDNDGTNPNYPLAVWSARDSGVNFPGVNAIIHSRAHTGTRGVCVPWRAGDPVADDWLFLDSTTIQTGDSLIFWMLLGTPDDLNLTVYIDTMQVHVCSDQDPSLSIAKIATIRSEDSNNVWRQFKFSLNQFAGQRVYLAFRYYMNTTVDGLWCNIDDIFVGNRSSVGITQNGTNVPDKFALGQNYPNPFNPSTKIRFAVPETGNVELNVYDSKGSLVGKLVNGRLNAGLYEYEFNAASLPSGAYFYRLSAGSFSSTKRMVLVK